MPAVVVAPACCAAAVEFATSAIDDLGKVSAQPRSAIILAVGDDIAMIGTAAPCIAASYRTMKAFIIGAGRIGTILAIHVARDCVAGKTTQERATDNADATAMR